MVEVNYDMRYTAAYTYLLCGLFLKHPYKRFCFFIFLIFTKRDLSRTMVRRVWRLLLPADHGIGGLICPFSVACLHGLYFYYIPMIIYILNVGGELLLGGAYSDSVFKANSDFSDLYTSIKRRL